MRPIQFQLFIRLHRCAFRRPDGALIGFAEVGKLASFRNIQLRTGCFCNPGGCQAALGLDTEALIQQLRSGHVCLDEVDIINGKHTGAVRVSIGYLTHSRDIDSFLQFLKNEFLNVPAPTTPFALSPTTFESPNHRGEGLYIESLFIYPIKSCAGMQVSNWPLRSRGE